MCRIDWDLWHTYLVFSNITSNAPLDWTLMNCWFSHLDHVKTSRIFLILITWWVGFCGRSLFKQTHHNQQINSGHFTSTSGFVWIVLFILICLKLFSSNNQFNSRNVEDIMDTDAGGVDPS